MKRESDFLEYFYERKSILRLTSEIKRLIFKMAVSANAKSEMTCSSSEEILCHDENSSQNEDRPGSATSESVVDFTPVVNQQSGPNLDTNMNLNRVVIPGSPIERIIDEYLLEQQEINERYPNTSPNNSNTNTRRLSGPWNSPPRIPPRALSVDLPASGDNFQSEPTIPLGGLVLATVSSGYLGSNESSSDTNSSTTTVNLASEQTPRPYLLQERNESEDSLEDPEHVNFSNPRNESENFLTVVNTENPETTWSWDQREIPSPASLVDEVDSEYGPDMVGYMQRLINSPSEEMFSRPASGSNSAAELVVSTKKNPGTRARSTDSFFFNPRARATNLLKSKQVEPHVLYHCVPEIHIPFDLGWLKRSKSSDNLSGKQLASNSMGDFAYVKILESAVDELTSGKSTPEGSSARSKRIDDNLSSLLDLCAEMEKRPDELNLNNDEDPILPQGPIENIPRACLSNESLFGGPPTIAPEVRQSKSVQDILNYVRCVAEENSDLGLTNEYIDSPMISENKELHESTSVEDIVKKMMSDNLNNKLFLSNAKISETEACSDYASNSKAPWKHANHNQQSKLIQTRQSPLFEYRQENFCRSDGSSSLVSLEAQYLEELEASLDDKILKPCNNYSSLKTNMEPYRVNKSVKLEDCMDPVVDSYRVNKNKLEVEQTRESEPVAECDENGNDEDNCRVPSDSDCSSISFTSIEQDESDHADLSEISPKFRVSREFSRKEENLRALSRSTSHHQFRARSRSVTFEDNYPLPLANRSGIRRRNSDLTLPGVEEDRVKQKHLTPILRKTTFCPKTKSSSPLLAATASELYDVKYELSEKSELIEESTESMEELLTQLQSLWLNLKEGGRVPTLPPSSMGGHRLTQLTSLCSFIVKEMETEWRTCVSKPDESQSLAKLSDVNRCLKDQLESSKVVQNCLQSEIDYVVKEKMLLKEEVRHLALHLAKLEASMMKDSNANAKQEEERPDTSFPLYYPKRHSSLGEAAPATNESETSSLADTDQSRMTTAESETQNQNNGAIAQKRDEDFNSIMTFFQERGSDINYYQEQLEKYDQEVAALKSRVEMTEAERTELKTTYDRLLEDHKELIRERGHYESVLKIILQEKQTNHSSLQELMETLIGKLNSMTDDTQLGAGGIHSSQINLLEGAIQAVQLQNVNYRGELAELKETTTKAAESFAAEKAELESNLTMAVKKVNELTRELSCRTDEINDAKKWAGDKLKRLEGIQTALSEANNNLEKELLVKDEEVKNLREQVETLHKNGLRQQKRIADHQKNSSRLTRDVGEQKRNLEALNNIVNQLRTNLKEQKAQWTERVQASNAEVTQSKEQQKWLQSQIENLNTQLKDAHDKVKNLEKEKAVLLGQVLGAEEERKVTDRRLQELRTHMAGDLVLRQALAERNEALTSEITRMRRQKLVTLGSDLVGKFEDPDSDAQPSCLEMSTLEALSSLNALPSMQHPEGPRRNNKQYRDRHVLPQLNNRRVNESKSAAIPGVSTQTQGYTYRNTN